MNPDQTVYKRQRCASGRTNLQSIRRSDGCQARAVPGSQYCREHRELSLQRTLAWIAGRKARTGRP